MSWQAYLTERGYVLVPGILNPTQCANWLSSWECFLNSERPSTILRTADGTIYGARNLLRDWPEIRDLLEETSVFSLVREILGPQAGLVRILFFDKPPEQSWALPWHKDLNISVRKNDRPSSQFIHPTFKHGVPHVEAPQSLLERMLTVRLHLDPSTETNGPLRVLPGSHQSSKSIDSSGVAPETILSNAGDALLMRPLLTHSSGDSQAGTKEHRRIFHFEFAGMRELPEGFEWWDFVRI
ncbi:phytanoyl-CoA dioxygenase family protein [Telmatocola sphagniphila]|uniref:Phytanoyl-CoA dioxygenase family protein n=1 Tax=Telmatocola sphagniphila TaxID=1123043 RepID=A0A8E6EWH0_9BACT|nr:phytanoyl-CoA dioxygenase family protein [Telmatocola sphagniphila]QVL30131.1 phytanoyl-CoA dioxygenase family protein [Telmatocola sphagniphila]